MVGCSRSIERTTESSASTRAEAEASLEGGGPRPRDVSTITTTEKKMASRCAFTATISWTRYRAGHRSRRARSRPSGGDPTCRSSRLTWRETGCRQQRLSAVLKRDERIGDVARWSGGDGCGGSRPRDGVQRQSSACETFRGGDERGAARASRRRTSRGQAPRGPRRGDAGGAPPARARRPRRGA